MVCLPRLNLYQTIDKTLASDHLVRHKKLRPVRRLRLLPVQPTKTSASRANTADTSAHYRACCMIYKLHQHTTNDNKSRLIFEFSFHKTAQRSSKLRNNYVDNGRWLFASQQYLLLTHRRNLSSSSLTLPWS